MVKRKEDMISEVREKMRGGHGQVEITHVFKKEELKGKVRLCARICLQPGSSIGFHRHEEEEEIFYVISGQGLADDNGDVEQVGPGDAILTGNGAGHSISNQGQVPLVLMAVILLYK